MLPLGQEGAYPGHKGKNMFRNVVGDGVYLKDFFFAVLLLTWSTNVRIADIFLMSRCKVNKWYFWKLMAF